MKVRAALRRWLCRCPPEPASLPWDPDCSIAENLLWAAMDGAMGYAGDGHVDGGAGKGGEYADVWMSDGSVWRFTVHQTDERWDGYE